MGEPLKRLDIYGNTVNIHSFRDSDFLWLARNKAVYVKIFYVCVEVFSSDESNR